MAHTNLLSSRQLQYMQSGVILILICNKYALSTIIM
jgi:hypothetical protein